MSSVINTVHFEYIFPGVFLSAEKYHDIIQITQLSLGKISDELSQLAESAKASAHEQPSLTIWKLTQALINTSVRHRLNGL